MNIHEDKKVGKINKMIKVAKAGARDPKKIVKGFKFLKKHGMGSFKERVKAVSNISSNMIDEDTRFDELVLAYKSKKFSIVLGALYENAELIVKQQKYKNVEICKDSKEATGEYLVFVGRDEALTEDACFEYAKVAYKEDADVIYSENYITGKNGETIGYAGKPEWSPHLILTNFYVGKTFAVKRELFDKIGGFTSDNNVCKKFDLFLRLTENTKKIYRTDNPAYSSNNVELSLEHSNHQKQALKNHLERVYGKNNVTIKDTKKHGLFNVEYSFNTGQKVSVIIPIKDHIDYLQKLLKSIFEKTSYKNYEIIVLDNNSVEEETAAYLQEIDGKNNVRVIPAKMEFNWSKINNYGAKYATGDILIFMNNDMEIISPDWIEQLVQYASQPEVGVVGPMLLYDDNTIQHAGVVIGMNTWADHIYKACNAEMDSSNFVLPSITRNVMAVTGACLAIEKKKFEEIKGFSEKFIICGSDIEIGIRAYEKGLYNVYNPNVKIYHYESKSRDSFIPEVDFEMSEKAYRKYRGKDPFYSKKLTYFNTTPELRQKPEFVSMKKTITATPHDIGEITPYTFRIADYPRKRLNLLVPTVNSEFVFGGISTAIKFFNELCERTGYDKRIISTDSLVKSEEIERYSSEYTYVECEEDSDAPRQLVSLANRTGRSLPVSENDYFVATAWWSAYCLQNAYKDLIKLIGYKPNPIVYLVQDYEPGFYPWSTRFMLAESTYKTDLNQIVVFNSSILKEFMHSRGYSFYKEYVLEPVFNDKLKEKFELIKNTVVKKEKKILIYGRPGVARNAIELIVHSLKEWILIQDDVQDWEILSAGEQFENFEIGMGIKVKSVGKLTLDEYAKMLETSYAGISLMVSPHPSYPPLEMATFGVKVITNTYSNKDLASFNKNIVSVDDISPRNVANKLKEICDSFVEEVLIEPQNAEYEECKDVFAFMDELKKDI